MMMKPHEHTVEVDRVFQQHGVQSTTQRRSTWQYFSNQPQGHTISEAVATLHAQGIGQATVYRTVELFLRLGLLTSTREAPGKIRYVAVCPGHKHTLICRACHHVVEFEDCDLLLLEKLLAAKTGYTIQGHHLELYGTCPACIGQ